MSILSTRWKRLCQVAADNQVPILAGYEHPDLKPTAWDGLWVSHASLGAAIALSSALDLCSAVWVLAHELGHEFTTRQGLVGSPLWDARTHLTTGQSQKRWGQGQLKQPEEEAANLWASQELITPEEWHDLELTHPASLKDMAASLELPVAAALWRARAEENCKGSSSLAKVTLDSRAIQELAKPVNGSGGHQSLIRRLQSGVRGKTLSLSRKDFNRIRECLLRTGGGFRSRYQAVMDCTLQAISDAGGVYRLFDEENP